jgi:hypothetical protein
MASRDEKLAAIFEAMEPRSERASTVPSETRAYIRANFDTIQAARQRGLTWPQITAVLTESGVKAPDGSPLQWRVLKSLFHAERYVIGGKRQRRRKPVKPPPKQQSPIPTLQPPESETDQDDQTEPQKRGFRFSKATPKVHTKE